MKLNLLSPQKSLNKAYRKEKVNRADIELLKQNLVTLFNNIGRTGDEEHLKSQLTYFLRDTWYKDKHQINPIEKNDLAIHIGKSVNDLVGVIIEVKSISNVAEMASETKPNAKALHELVLYYLRERIDKNNNEIKYLVATNIEDWFIFDANEFDKKVYRNTAIKKLYELKKSDNKDNPFFYEELRKIFQKSDIVLDVTHFAINDYKKAAFNADKTDDNALITLHKILSPVHLLKQPFANDSNSLDTKFYAELLHIIGLEEEKENGKKVIKRKSKPDTASLLENAIVKIQDRDCLHNVPNFVSFGDTQEERLYHVALELCITWVNRILFLKLLEAQLFKYNKRNKDFLFLNIDLIHDFDELSNLFFQVLAEKPGKRREELQKKFNKVPYLNSSLFERTELERQTIDISSLDNRLPFKLHVNTVLKDDKGKSKAGTLPTLQYLFDFLDSYDFTSEGTEEIQEQNKNLINASVLGLIFEKINGYKDGSFFTPGFITMYMCKEVIRRSVVQKFNKAKGWSCETLDQIYNKIEDKREANRIINSLTLCDPAVGSGHFLVSALNELIAIKSELKVLIDKQGVTLRDYEVEVVNDELIVTDDNGNSFDYNPTSKESQRVQETLFHEKEIIIENCLFGVDINPNSIKICRLRLWIELLKNAYYTKESNFKELETLPNIDINIKCGNSLISRFPLDANIKDALKKSKWSIESYKVAVQTYREAESKEQKREMERLIEAIKKDFRSEISINDPKVKKLSKLRGELFNLSQTKELFDEGNKKNKETKKKIEKLAKDIGVIEDQIEEIKNNKIYENAFEWRFEFPEVLNDDGDFVGFDTIIGNPPYIQLQKLGADSDALQKVGYETFTKTGDIYSLFYELGYRILKDKGFLIYITSNKWMRAAYGESLRQFFVEKTNPLVLIDFSGSQIFDSATVDTNILLFSRDKNRQQTLACIVKEKVLNNLSVFVSQFGSTYGFNTKDSWVILSPIEQSIKAKIEKVGTPLKDWDINIYRGILTGCNEAFIIDGKKKNELIATDPKSAEIIRPILRGRDIKRYGYDFADLWLINTHNGIKENGIGPVNINKYPAVKSYLDKFYPELAKRTDKGNTPYNLRNCAYMEDFYKQKIVWGEISDKSNFALDNDDSYFVNNKCYLLTGSRLEYLVCFLNSHLSEYLFSKIGTTTGVGTAQWSKFTIEQLLIPLVTKEQEEKFIFLLSELKAGRVTEACINQRIYEICGLSVEEITFIEAQSL